MLSTLITRIMNRISVEGYQTPDGFYCGKMPDNFTDSDCAALPTRARRNLGGRSSLSSVEGQFCGDDIRPAAVLNSFHAERGNL